MKTTAQKTTSSAAFQFSCKQKIHSFFLKDPVLCLLLIKLLIYDKLPNVGTSVAYWNKIHALCASGVKMFSTCLPVYIIHPPQGVQSWIIMEDKHKIQDYRYGNL